MHDLEWHAPLTICPDPCGAALSETLATRLRKRAEQLKPEWSTASNYWYDHGGRQQRDDAALLREAADALEALTSDPTESRAESLSTPDRIGPDEDVSR